MQRRRYRKSQVCLSVQLAFDDPYQSLQAMDNSHVALVAVHLEAAGFKKYRCDRPMPLGVNLTSLTKVLKCAKDDDLCTIKAADDGDILNLTYEAKSTRTPLFCRIVLRLSGRVRLGQDCRIRHETHGY
jgi:proliferating cell nuclear antigen PCNA